MRLTGLEKALIWSGLAHLVVLGLLVAFMPGAPAARAEGSERLVVRTVNLASFSPSSAGPALGVSSVPAPSPSVTEAAPRAAEPVAEAPPPAASPRLPGLSYPRSSWRPGPAPVPASTPAAVSAPPGPEGPEPEWTPPADWREAPAPDGGGTGDASGEGRTTEAFPVSTPPIRVPSGYAAVEESLLVRFAVEADGQVTVELLRGSGDARLDRLALETLQQWKWRPATAAGRPVASKVEVEVELLR